MDVKKEAVSFRGITGQPLALIACDAALHLGVEEVL